MPLPMLEFFGGGPRKARGRAYPPQPGSSEVNWRFTTNDARIKPKRLSPSQAVYLRIRLLPKHPRKWLGLEVEHRFAMLQIDRHRVLMVHDQPLAVDLAEAGGPTQPEIGLLPSVPDSAYPVEAVAEGHVIAHRDGQVVNFIMNRALEDEECLFPNFRYSYWI